jgi:nucleoid DNA-binding protein/cell division septation protein DedD
MQSIESHIKNLLLSHECVMVPGFGAFIVNAKPAHFDGHSSMLYAPGKSLSFNKSIAFNDGLLASAIAKEENVSYAEASAAIAQQADLWQNTLKAEKEISLTGLGKFALAEDSIVHFEPLKTGNFALNSYGLPALSLRTSTEAKKTVQLPRIKKVKNVKSRKVWVRSSTAVMALLVLAVTGYFFNANYLQVNKNVKEAGLIAPSVPAPEATKQTTPVNEVSKIVNEVSRPVVQEAETSSAQQFYVIGGSFSKKQNAEKLVRELTNKGFHPTVIDNENGFYRVSYLSEKDSSAADKELKKIKLSDNSGAWLLKW